MCVSSALAPAASLGWAHLRGRQGMVRVRASAAVALHRHLQPGHLPHQWPEALAGRVHGAGASETSGARASGSKAAGMLCMCDRQRRVAMQAARAFWLEADPAIYLHGDNRQAGVTARLLMCAADSVQATHLLERRDEALQRLARGADLEISRQRRR